MGGAAVSPFEFFFSFYGLLLGFSVAELVGGFARVVHERKSVRFGLLTPLLALFVALDMITFWNQAWTVFRFAPFNMFLLTLGLVVASIFYLSATLVFPKTVSPGIALDDHFWEHRRLVLLGVLAANWIVASLFLSNGALTGELASLNLPILFWLGLALFTLACLVAALAPSRRVASGALVVLLLYQGYNIVRAGWALAEAGGWWMLQPPPT